MKKFIKKKGKKTELVSTTQRKLLNETLPPGAKPIEYARSF